MQISANLRVALFIILGVVLIIIPGVIIDAIIYVIALVPLLIGVVKLVECFREQKAVGNVNLIAAIFLIVVGALIISFRRELVSILPIFVGALLVVVGIYQLFIAMRSGGTGGKTKLARILMSLVVIAGGIMSIMNPFVSLTLLFRLLGGFVIVMGVNELLGVRGSKK